MKKLFIALLSIGLFSLPAFAAYDINYPEGTKITHGSRWLYSVNLSQDQLGTQSVAVTQSEDKLLYFDRTSTEIYAIAGASMNLNFNWNGGWMNGYFYIDRNNDGEFAVDLTANGLPTANSELLAFSHLNGKTSDGTSTNGSVLNQMPAFTVPADLTPGKYRARAKIDWDNADPAGSKTILKDGGAIVDFTIVVPEGKIEVVTIKPMPLNGMIFAGDGSPLPETLISGSSLEVKAVASLPGYATDHIIVRHGSSDSLQDTKISLNANGTATIPGDCLSGEVTIYALFEEEADSEWTKIWGDEFNSDALDFTTWSYHPRYSSTWNRYCAKGNEEGAAVNTFGNGYYNSWCKPTDKAQFPNETADMISGAIYTGGKFEFHYGRIEARIKTSPFKGNFPAFWLMPASNAEGSWPRSGEIDIWEQIDTSDRAYNTVHTGWTGWKNYCGWTDAPKQSSPANSGNVAVQDVYTWHYYALEWDADELRWYVDGKLSFRYKNMHYSEPGTNYTEQICWPFYKNFYVILNQSVGNGSWAQWADTSHTYLTQFDYVRAYQKKGEDTYISKLQGNGDDPNFFTPIGEDNIQDIKTTNEAPEIYFDLQGRKITNPGSGIFILNQGNASKKVIR